MLAQHESMRELLRRSSALLSQHRILWLPVLLADLAGYGLVRLQFWFVHSVVPTLATTQSVLSSNTIPTDIPHASSSVQLLLWFVPAVVSMLRIILYVSAMLTTSLFVQAYTTGQLPAFSAARHELSSRKLEVVVFAFFVFACAGVVMFLSSGLMAFGYQHGYLNAVREWSYSFGILIGTVAFALVAYGLAPLAVRLLAEPFVPVATSAMREARWAAAVTLLVNGVLVLIVGFVISHIARLVGPGNVIYLFVVLGSLVMASPYLFLFVALSLLANDGMPIPLDVD